MIMVEVKALQQLSKKQVGELAAFLNKSIHTDKSGWVCQGALLPDSYGVAYLTLLQEQAQASALPSLNVDRWIGVADGKLAGICSCSRGIPDRTITLFLVDESLPNRLDIADAIALRSIEDMLADKWGKRNFLSYFPDNSPAAAYAKLCGFRKTLEGPVASGWEIGVKELRDNILARQK